ncbi:MAG: phage terminase large subunit family protein, partial [Campylobacterales bacterium]|nr:phage terminase large subunit family protein [Campylobacterales bacterium]
MSVTEFCEKNRVMPEGSPIEGYYNSKFAPYQAFIQDLYNDPEVREVYCKMASQVGKSEIIYNINFYKIVNNPGNALICYPTKEAIKDDVVKKRINPMIEKNDIIKKLFDKKGKKNENTIYFKTYSGSSGSGSLKFAGCNVPSDLAGNSVPDLFIDEHSRCAEDVGTEGDPTAVAKKRQAAYKGSSKTFFFSSSSPTVMGKCAISKGYETSKRHVCEVPCYFCNQYQEIIWDMVKWENDDPETAYIECAKCKAK